MSVELFPVLEGYDEYHFYGEFGGKSLVQDLEQLDELAREMDVVPLSNFTTPRDNEIQWFSPDDGLKTVQSLIKQITSTPGCLNLEDDSDEELTLSELEEMEAILIQAQQEDKRFRIGDTA